MRGAITNFLGSAIAAVAATVVAGFALAQVEPRPGVPGSPKSTIPEKMLPPSEGIPAPAPAPGSSTTPSTKPDQSPPVPSRPAVPADPAPNPAPGTSLPKAPGGKESLTDKLERTDGVLTPPPNVAPPMTVQPPAPKIDPEMVVPPPAPQQTPK